MKFFGLTYLFVFFFIGVSTVYGQTDSTASDTTLRDSLRQVISPDSLMAANSTASDSAAKPDFTVYPWQYNVALASELVSSDSTLRWQIWPNWIYKKNRDPGVITYRLGTIARTNAFTIHSHGPQYQQLEWEDVNMNDPVTGTVNWDLIPFHKLKYFYENDGGINHTSLYFLKQYYLTEPLSQLIYKESKFDTRNLEFIVSQNFGARTNAEISYWDRRDGGEYSNSSIQGRQIFARVFHQLDHRQAFKIHFLNNNYTIGEPFGYNIPDLTRFAFNRYLTNADRSSAESNLSVSNLALNYYRRGADTTKVSSDNFHAGLFLNSRERNLTYPIDTTYYKVQSVGASAHKWLDLNLVELEGSVSGEWFFNRDSFQSALDISSWSLYKGKAAAVVQPVPFLEVGGNMEGKIRNDGFSSYIANLETTLRAGRLFSVSGAIASGTVMPTLQQLYWTSVEYQGNPDLQNEQITSLSGEVTVGLTSQLNIGVRGQLKDIERGIMIRQDSTFTNADLYRSISASTYFEFTNRRFELTGSATYHRFDQQEGPDTNLLQLDESERVWLKGGAYIKGYLFDKATYVKAGLSGMISPFRYQAAHYNPVLDFWQPVSDDQFLPAFSRLDFDVSARVRTIMITLRWENVLDDVSQLGYFETAQYPMGQRRFIFGIRALFRN